MTHESTEPTSDHNAPDSAGDAGPLVWHPWIRALAWIIRWTVFAESAAIVWEYADTGILRWGQTIARSGLILLAIALLTVAVFLIDLWSTLWMHAFRNYERRAAAQISTVESLIILALLGLYLWLCAWVLRQAWPPLRGFGAVIDLGKTVVGSIPTLLVWGVLLPGSICLAWPAYCNLRQAADCYVKAVRMLGFKRTVHGVLLMSLVRLRLPRRDFFLQSPIFSWAPPLALCVFLHVGIEQAALRWLIPGSLLCLFLPKWLEMIAPPTWIFLGKSDFQSFAAFYTMRHTWRQHGLTLLDRIGPEGTQFYTAWRQSTRLPLMFFDPSVPRVWSIRTRPQLWEYTVLLLMDFVLVVVVDLRGESDVVRKELAWLAKPGRVEKAWYLVADDDQGAQQYREHVDVSRLVTEQMLLAAEWLKAGLRIGVCH